MTIATPQRILKPVTISGNSAFARPIHRIALAPLTRYRNSEGTQAPTDLSVEYYRQRASQDGLLISEATLISEAAGGFDRAPGIWSDFQVTQWKKVTDAVHAKGGIIYVQLWNLGRTNPGTQASASTVYAPSAIGLEGLPVPVELTLEKIDEFIADYRKAAENALKAGFDGVELHGANGYMVDQFFQSMSNKRTDDYGGTPEKRAKFALRAMKEIAAVFGQERMGIRFSPWGRFQDMMEDDPYETFIPINKLIRKEYPKLAYVHLTEPRTWAELPHQNFPAEHVYESNDPLRAIWRSVDTSAYETPSAFAKAELRFEDPTPENPTVIISGAGHNDSNIREFVERTGDVAAVGRYFISNPDLPERVWSNHPWTPYDRAMFYRHDAIGYTDYLTWKQQQQQQQVEEVKA